MSMVYEIMSHVRNYFLIPGGAKSGEFTIQNGAASLPFLKSGQYYLIIGSVFNDGVHIYNDGYYSLKDETFTGDIAPLNPPQAFISLCKEIEEWQEKNAQAVSQPYQSESFGGYSYSRATGASGGSLSWQDVFRSRLNTWRCM